MRERIVMIEHAVETLGYFSRQLAEGWEKLGLDVYFIDYEHIVETMEGLFRFLKKGSTVLCTFNFIGISGEEIFTEANGRTIWENYKVSCFNIIVDHPLYYHSKLLHPFPDMRVFCVDRGHVTYMKRFYPQIPVEFLPLAGNEIWSTSGKEKRLPEIIPYEKRAYDIVFTGNYVPTEHLYHEIEKQGEDYKKFYSDIIEDMKAHPSIPIEKMLETHIQNELGDVSERELCAANAGMVVVDICLRSYFRGEIIKVLVEQKIPVHVFGANWDRLICSNKEYLFSNGRMVDSAVCAKAIANARISLNIMPWFKDGAHDRIFTAMLQHTLSLTDDSRYLREEFTDQKELFFYSLEKKEELPKLVHSLLEKPKICREIAENGYKSAIVSHTWKERAGQIWHCLKE